MHASSRCHAAVPVQTDASLSMLSRFDVSKAKRTQTTPFVYRHRHQVARSGRPSPDYRRSIHPLRPLTYRLPTTPNILSIREGYRMLWQQQQPVKRHSHHLASHKLHPTCETVSQYRFIRYFHKNFCFRKNIRDVRMFKETAKPKQILAKLSVLNLSSNK